MQTVTVPMEELAQLLQLQLAQSGRAALNVTGNSMKPMLHGRRDVVYLVPPDSQRKKGDLILYRRESGQYVLHRIVRVPSAETFICSGDNQWEPEAVSNSQIVAVVDGFSRNGKLYDVNHKGYGFYVWGWAGLFPFRRPIIALRRKVGRLVQLFKKRK